jgi:hypothetical protein
MRTRTACLGGRPEAEVVDSLGIGTGRWSLSIQGPDRPAAPDRPPIPWLATARVVTQGLPS